MKFKKPTKAEIILLLSVVSVVIIFTTLQGCSSYTCPTYH